MSDRAPTKCIGVLSGTRRRRQHVRMPCSAWIPLPPDAGRGRQQTPGIFESGNGEVSRPLPACPAGEGDWLANVGKLQGFQTPAGLPGR